MASSFDKKTFDQSKYKLKADSVLPEGVHLKSSNIGELEYSICPECGSKNITGGKKPVLFILGCLFGQLVALPFSLLSSAIFEEDKIFYSCFGCGHKWYAGYIEDAAIKEATKSDQKNGCIFIFFLFIVVILYLVLK